MVTIKRKKEGKSTYYYLQHSIRKGSRVQNKEIYLGRKTEEYRRNQGETAQDQRVVSSIREGKGRIFERNQTDAQILQRKADGDLRNQTYLRYAEERREPRSTLEYLSVH